MPYSLSSSRRADSTEVNICYRIGRFELDPRRIELTAGGMPAELSRKPTQLLIYLIEHRERIVTREELRSALWPGVAVGNGSLTQAIWEIRQAFGDGRASPRFIATCHGRGYRFVGSLELLAR